jgi:hypothetical protein
MIKLKWQGVYINMYLSRIQNEKILRVSVKGTHVGSSSPIAKWIVSKKEKSNHEILERHPSRNRGKGSRRKNH